MATFRELLTKISFHVEHEPLEKVEHQLEGIHKKLEFLAAAEVIKGVYELTEKFTKFAEEIHNAATTAGITVEAFQKLAFAASKSGVSQDEMGMAMARLSRNVYNARNGSKEAQEVFMRAGFTQGQISSFKTGSDAMLALADRMKNSTDAMKNSAVAQELLGRGGFKMVAFLKQGSGAIKGMGEEAERLGIILSEGQVKSLVEVEHSLITLFGVFKGIGAYIASLFGPSITFLIDRFLKFIEVNKELLQQNIKDWVWKITYAMGFVYGIIETVVMALVNWIKTHQSLATSIGALVAVFTILTGALLAAKFAWGLLSGGVSLWLNLFKGIPALIDKVNYLFGENSVITKIAAGAQWAWNVAMNAGQVALGILNFEVAALGAPIYLISAAIGLLVVAIHDIWETAHGRPGIVRWSWCRSPTSCSKTLRPSAGTCRTPRPNASSGRPTKPSCSAPVASNPWDA